MAEERRIPFANISEENESLRSEIEAAMKAVIDGSKFILGPAVEEFEKDFANYCDAKHAVAVNSGTTALQLALIACGVGEGDEVITTPHSWISTSWAIRYVGAKPVFVDVNADTCILSPDLVEAAITPKTKAILPVHLYGRAADMPQLRAIADKHKLALIEDAAQAHGARRDGRRVGSHGDCGCFSFYPAKNLGAWGEGGAITTNDAAKADHMRRLRDHAQDGRHHHTELGFNARMDGLQGATLGVKLKHLDQNNAGRASAAAQYANELAGVAGIKLPSDPGDAGHVWHLYSVVIEDLDREEFRNAMKKRGVDTGVHYPTPIHLQPAFADLGHERGSFPVAEDIMARCVSLPMFPGLPESDVNYVCEMIRDVLKAG
ncbi:MAG: erythromycin biosynthesis sensory transduction protein eryC1 [Verrucomicrobiales bacterium]|nr:erythromycin biosynthesis sensory transduction protein eryC1 [Verrucomicrobiales bacterium]|tara:strand:- start:3462 stop:4589 length:1128 start_codon:yes stop_codon:yes gene_type:complete